MTNITRCDIALALAPLRRRPGTAAIIVILFAAACALSTVNFSTFLFLYARPLPYPNYERVVYLGQAGSLQRSGAGDQQTLDNFLFLQTELTSAERVAAYNPWRNETLRHQDTSETVTGCWITPGFFEVLGISAALGVTFSDPANIGQSPRPLVLSDRLWTQRFQRNPDIIHQTVWLGNRPHVVVGVMGADFEMPGLSSDEQPAYWAPLDPKDIPKPEWRSRWYPTLVLLKTGVSSAQLQAELDVATLRLREAHPGVMAERRLVANDLKEWLLGDNRRYFNLLIIVAALLSVLVLVNLVNLLIGQIAGRHAYLTTVRALGADRMQMLTPLLLEHVVLAGLGMIGAVPLALAYRHLLIDALGRAGLALPTFETGLFVASACVLTLLVLAAVVFATNALQREGSGTSARLVANSRSVVGRSSGWIDSVAVLSQTSLAIMLLVACALLALSLRRQASANADLPLVALQNATLVMPQEKYPTQADVNRRLLEVKAALAALPEIRGAAIANPSMPGERNPLYGMIDDLDTVPAKDSTKYVIRPAACPDYFKLAGLPLVSGRVFTEQDMASSRRLMVVSQRAAELHWPGRDPVGRRLLINHRTDDWAEVIGVVGNIESSQTNQALPLVWRSFNHHAFRIANLVFETRTGALLPRKQFDEFLRGIDPDIVVAGYLPVSEILERQRWMQAAIARLSLLLAIVASVVSAFGIFSILSRRVAAFSKEIAVRKALGASAWHVVSSIGKRDLGWVFGGVLLGATFSLIGGKHFFDVSNLRGAELVGAPLIGSAGVLLAAVIGAVVPALRALATDTLALLRSE